MRGVDAMNQLLGEMRRTATNAELIEHCAEIRK
jgi:hypothetical protein